MNGKLKNILPLAGLFCGSIVFAPAFADMDSNSSDTSAKSGTYSQITPPAGFAAAPGVGFSIDADFIYWEARQANIDYAESGVAGTNAVTSQGKVHYPGFKYQPGFKVGVAIDVGHDNWDITADYVWLNGSGNKHTVTLPYSTTTLTPTTTLYIGSTSLTGELLTEADSTWNLHYNVVDLDLGRNYYISQYLTLRPYFGLSGSWNNQSQLTHYTYSDSTNTTGDFISQFTKQHYWGVGFSTGMNTAWCFDENWSIYGDLCVMNLWSRYKVSSKETDYTTASGVVDYTSGTISLNTAGVQYGIQNVIDLEMGIRWGMRFDDDTMGIMFQVGWDQQIWINHAQYGTSAGNLSLQGLDVKARFDF